MKKLIFILFILTLVLMCNKKNESFIIPDKSIRFRIIANSNNKTDQTTKLEIKEELQKSLIANLSTDNYKITEENIKENLKTVDNILEKYNINYDISYGNNYFPKKIYKGVTYPEGNYQSLVITLGEGKGDNWWCVLFPPLCLLEAEESELNEVEYSFYAKKIIDNIIQ